MDKCPSDFISLVKICVLIQSLELILERGGLVERENPVYKKIRGRLFVVIIVCFHPSHRQCNFIQQGQKEQIPI